jgi:MFS family permease
VVLLASSRGLSPADIGVVFAVYSMVVLLLELPTGGLADAVGTRPVLVASGLAGAAGLLSSPSPTTWPLRARRGPARRRPGAGLRAAGGVVRRRRPRRRRGTPT